MLNWVDAVIVGILAIFVLQSIGRSFILELLDFSSFISAYFLSFLLYNIPGKFFEGQFSVPHELSLVLGFMVIWFLSETLFYILIRASLPRLSRIKIPAINALSIIPAFLKSLIFIAIILVMVATFPIQPSIKKAVIDSKIGSQILRNAYQMEGPMKNVFGGVSNDTLTFLTVKPKTDEKIKLGFQTDEISVDEESERLMMDLVNNERVSRGIKSLTFDSKLRDIAKLHGEDMFQRGYFSHFTPEGLTVADRANKVGYGYLVIGENLAYAPSLDLAHKGLMNSKGHRENILSTDYNKFGIGVIDGGVYGKMFTQVFSN